MRLSGLNGLGALTLDQYDLASQPSGSGYGWLEINGHFVPMPRTLWQELGAPPPPVAVAKAAIKAAPKPVQTEVAQQASMTGQSSAAYLAQQASMFNESPSAYAQQQADMWTNSG